MNWGRSGIATLITFVLAALLGPEDFGLVAMAIAYIAVIELFLEQGLTPAIIQRKKLTDLHLDSAFWMMLALCIILTSVSIALSQWWAGVNDVAELAALIYALSVIVPIRGLTVVQEAVLQRELDFRCLAIRTNCAVLAGGGCGLALALAGLGVWALVAQRLVQSGVGLILLWSLSHWRPRLRFSLRAIRHLLGFSIANFASKLGGFARIRGSVLIVGALLGPTTVGLFAIAERLVQTPIRLLTHSLLVASLPHFSRLQDEPEKLRHSIVSCIRLSSVLTIPVLAVVAVSSDRLMAVLGPEWRPASDPLKVLCLLGVGVAVSEFSETMLQALSKPHLLAVLSWITGAVTVAALLAVALVFQGKSTGQQIMGVALAVTGSFIVLALPLRLYWLNRLAGIPFMEVAGAVGPGAFTGLAVLAVGFLLDTVVPSNRFHPLVSLAFVVAPTAMMGALAMLRADRTLRAEVLTLFSWQRSRSPDPNRKAALTDHSALADHSRV